MGSDVWLPEAQKGVILPSRIGVETEYEATSAALRTKDPKDLTFDRVSTTLIDDESSWKANSQSNSTGKGTIIMVNLVLRLLLQRPIAPSCSVVIANALVTKSVTVLSTLQIRIIVCRRRLSESSRWFLRTNPTAKAAKETKRRRSVRSKSLLLVLTSSDISMTTQRTILSGQLRVKSSAWPPMTIIIDVMNERCWSTVAPLRIFSEVMSSFSTNEQIGIWQSKLQMKQRLLQARSALFMSIFQTLRWFLRKHCTHHSWRTTLFRCERWRTREFFSYFEQIFASFTLMKRMKSLWRKSKEFSVKAFPNPEKSPEICGYRNGQQGCIPVAQSCWTPWFCETR